MERPNPPGLGRNRPCGKRKGLHYATRRELSLEHVSAPAWLDQITIRFSAG
jgi:hypothetical protein